ncbi:hypothetical protein NXV57_26025 [Bacteroides thetaiotaomicron]|nr:hypothetical protein [Bacteroides thetaiotaomicron]
MIPVHEFYLTDDLGNRYLESGKFELQGRYFFRPDLFQPSGVYRFFREREDRRCPVLLSNHGQMEK